MRTLVLALEGFFLFYFLFSHVGHLALNLMAIPALRRKVSLRPLEQLPPLHPGFQPPVSLLLAARDEEATIASRVHRLLQLDYPEFEVVVVNDGSKDGTMEALIAAFELEPFPEAHWRRLRTQELRSIYHSRTTPGLRVIDKVAGGRGDALNVGINASRYPLFCPVDAHAILQRDGLRRLAEPFLEDPDTVASGATARVANGCAISGGLLQHVALPAHPLALLQVVESLRTFLFARLGWSHLDAVLCMSGAPGVLRKDVVVEAGGYRTDTLDADMELIVRLHRVLRDKGARYAIRFVPDPVCWIEAPESLATLQALRIRSQRGLAESLHRNIGLMTQGGGAPGRLAFPFFLAFECYGPLIEVAGYLFMAAMFLLGALPGAAFAAFLALAFSLGFLLSASSLLLEEMSFRTYPRLSQAGVLACAAAFENLGYRQLTLVWRTIGLAAWIGTAGAPGKARARRL